jgi:hypothetical protein
LNRRGCRNGMNWKKQTKGTLQQKRNRIESEEEESDNLTHYKIVNNNNTYKSIDKNTLKKQTRGRRRKKQMELEKEKHTKRS